MRTNRLDRFAALAVVAVLGGVVFGSIGTSAAFVVSTGNTGNTYSTIPDWKPPIISQAIALKAEGGIPGYVRASGSYRALANVADDPSSNPPAGIASVVTNVSTLSAGATALAMTAAANTVAGLAYTHQSAAQTVAAGKAAGTYAGSVTSSDAVTPANTSTAFPFNTVVDNTAPVPVSATVTNGGIAGRMDANDTITYTWSETVDPNSVVAGWTGAAPTPVTVRINNVGGSTGDTLLVYNSANTAQLPFGTIPTHVRDFVSAPTTFGASTNPTRSTLAWNGSTSFTLTFGAADTPASVNTTGTNSANYDWVPQTVIYDRAGNLSTNPTYTETGALDRDF